MKSQYQTQFIRPRKARGGAIIETVIVLSLLVMISMGAVQYGFAFYLKHALQLAAATAARVAVMPNSTDAQVTTAVSNQMTASGFGGVGATVTTVPSSVASVASGTYVTVTVTASWSHVGFSPLPTSLGGFSPTRNFTASTTMMHE